MDQNVNVSMQQAIRQKILRGLTSVTHFLVQFWDSQTKEWVPYGSYPKRYIAEYFEVQCRKAFGSNTIICPIEHYEVTI
jgi:hypothetical protein